MSIHTERARRLACRKRAFGGSDRNRELWTWSKRELIECALHLAAICTDSYEGALEGEGALQRLREERINLRRAGMI